MAALADDAPIRALTEMQLARFWNYVRKGLFPYDECWLWVGPTKVRGKDVRAIFCAKALGRLTHSAQRVSYFIAHGKLDSKRFVRPKCREQRCVNPRHLEQVTLSQSQRAGFGFPAMNRLKTHCDSGHEFTPESTYIEVTRGGVKHRRCRICRARDGRRHRAGYQGRERKPIERAVVVKMLAEGKTWLAIAAHFGVSDVAVRKRAMKWGLLIPKARRRKRS